MGKVEAKCHRRRAPDRSLSLPLHILRTVDAKPGYGGGLSSGEGGAIGLSNAKATYAGIGVGRWAGTCGATAAKRQRVSGGLCLMQLPLAHGDPAAGSQPFSVFTQEHVTTLNDIGTSRESSSCVAPLPGVAAYAEPARHTFDSSRLRTNARPTNARIPMTRSSIAKDAIRGTSFFRSKSHLV